MVELTSYKCPDCPFGGPKVGSIGNPKARAVLVGESPGRREVRAKPIPRPFIGDSGELLWHTLPGGEDLDYWYVTNALWCSPRKKKDESTLNEGCRLCHDRLIEEMTEHPRDIIVAMGNAAVRSLTNNYGIKITKARGRSIPSELAKYGIMPVVHPAALLRGTGTYRQFQQDLRRAYELSQGAPPREPIKPWHCIIDTDEGAKWLVERVLEQVRVQGTLDLGADIETTGFDRRLDEILCLGIAWEPHHVHMVAAEQIRILKPLFADDRIIWCWHNGKFDSAFLVRDGLPARVDEDTMLLSYTLEELPGVHDLEQVAKDVVNASDYKYMIQPFLPNKNSSYALIPKPVLYEYGSYDVSNTLQIKHHLRKQVNEDPRDKKLYEELLLPASDFLRKVEWRGIKVDPLRINSLDIVFGDELEELKEKLYEIVGRPFNANSWQQVAEILYVQYELKSRHKDTRKDTLEKLLPHPFVEAMLRYRKVAKAHGTYVKGIRRETSDDGRIHTTFKIHGTRTGRLSSAEPNMQNIPRDSKTRGMFVAEDEKVFIELDLNQAELRSLACLSGDKILCDIYNSTDRSLHNETAIMIFGEDYDSEDKMKAKTVNFGIVYGRTAGSLAEHFEISLQEAQRWINGWAKGYPEAWMFIRKCRGAPRKLLTMWTSFGRKKRHRLVTRELLWNMMNEAANFPHQSIASDINLLSGIKCDEYLEEELNSRIVNLIHDALLIEAPANWEVIDAVIKYVCEVMESLPPKYGLIAVPFKAEAKIGFRWGKQYMHDYKPGDPYPIRLRKELKSDILRIAA